MDCPICGSSFELVHKDGDVCSFRCSDEHKEGCGVTFLVKGLNVIEETPDYREAFLHAYLEESRVLAFSEPWVFLSDAELSKTRVEIGIRTYEAMRGLDDIELMKDVLLKKGYNGSYVDRILRQAQNKVAQDVK